MSGGQPWPKTAEELIDAQRGLDRADPPLWRPVDLEALHVAAAWVCFARGVTGTGSAGDPAWAAAVTMFGGRLTERAVAYGQAASGYIPGLLALRIGPLLGEVVGHLGHRFDVLLVDATGRDHPRHAGLAVHLGAVLGVPTIGSPTGHLSQAVPGPRTGRAQSHRCSTARSPSVSGCVLVPAPDPSLCTPAGERIPAPR